MKNQKADQGRRTFIKTLGAAGGAAAVIAASGEVAAQTESEGPDTKVETKGYRETDHVRAYYQSARI
ncbi:twin-arginine translocation signal domain-containing protein [Motiliproteus sp. SC1-56]|uniref:twin-arginine translocation signal domain-containing protein n=1 Tax=Motiliproteus sp. SC1-56 TaxID=2799565 RepID=UPI001A8DB0C3|nr:twin-arginine translocation signal domain-containing protein [Motiliproteus sp. SC1-56]